MSSDMLACIKTFLCNESGATAIEYAIVAGAICVAIATAVSAAGSAPQADFEPAEAGLKD